MTSNNHITFHAKASLCGVILLLLMEVYKGTRKQNLRLTASLYRWQITHLFPFVLVKKHLCVRILLEWNSIAFPQLCWLNPEIFYFFWFPSLTTDTHTHACKNEINKDIKIRICTCEQHLKKSVWSYTLPTWWFFNLLT